MEAVLFMLNSITVAVMVYMALRDDRRPTGEPETSVFRPLDDDALRLRARVKQERPKRGDRNRAR